MSFHDTVEINDEGFVVYTCNGFDTRCSFTYNRSGAVDLLNEKRKVRAELKTIEHLTMLENLEHMIASMPENGWSHRTHVGVPVSSQLLMNFPEHKTSNRKLSQRAEAMKELIRLNKMGTGKLGMAELIQHELLILHHKGVLKANPPSEIEAEIWEKVRKYMTTAFGEDGNITWLPNMEFNLAYSNENELLGMQSILNESDDGDKRVNDILLRVYNP